MHTTTSTPTATSTPPRLSTPPPRLWRGTPVEVGRALVNYSSAEIARIKGLHSGGVGEVLGYADSEYVALRENVSLTVR